MTKNQRPHLKVIGILMILIGFALPLVIHFGRSGLLEMLSGNSTAPNQNAMVVVLLAYVIGIPGGILMIIVGGVLHSMGRKPPKAGKGFDVIPSKI